MICDTCGQPYSIGDWPFCPHGRSRLGVHDDTLPGGARYVHNIDDRPIFIETKTQYREELAKRGLRQAERASYNKDDSSPYATRTRLKPGRVDPFLTGARDQEPT